MDFEREWTAFALEAEVDAFGTMRIATAHNEQVKSAYQRGLADGLKRVVDTLVRLGYLKGGRAIDVIIPRHGNCCTCQKCGYHHDDCVCAHNELLKAIEAEMKGG